MSRIFCAYIISLAVLSASNAYSQETPGKAQTPVVPVEKKAAAEPVKDNGQQAAVKQAEPAKKAEPKAAVKKPAARKAAAPKARKAPVVKTAKEDGSALNDKLVDITAKVVPSVVSVHVVRSGSENRFSTVNNSAFPFNAPATRPTTIMSGSGIILDKRGNIATNYHVIRDAASVVVQLYDNREYICDIVGSDPATDIAIVRIALNVPPDITPITFANSSAVRSGQIAVAIGNSYGFQNTASMGIISSVGRPGNVFAEVGDFLQTDASLNPGNSGGALVDMGGALIGMNTAVYSRSGGSAGLGFSIPSNMIKTVSERIISTGMVLRGWSGLLTQELNPDRATRLGLQQKGGAVVTDVVKGSPAASAGAATGDIVLSADGRAIKTARELYERIMDKRPGDKLALTVLRGGKKVNIDIFMAKYPDTDYGDSAGSSSKSLGIAVSDVDEDAAIQYKIADRNGVVVSRIDTGLSAESSGMEIGDLIKEADGKPVPTVEDFSRVADELRGRKSVVFLIKRRGIQKFITIYLR